MNIFGVEIQAATLATFISVLIAGGALMIGWLQWRDRQFRKDDVLKWANDVIRTLQTLYLTCYLGDNLSDDPARRKTLNKLVVETSVLVEQGRLLFRNTPDPVHGKDRHPAYRGYRPELLDPIVVAHQIASQWADAEGETKFKMTLISEDCVKRFVSLVQHEVGRSRTVSADAARRGEGESLAILMGKLTASRLEAIRSTTHRSL